MRVTTAVDQYWGGHTVRAKRFRSRRASERNLEWRFEQYPLFREFSALWGSHDGEVLLDYGCGPGNDLTGYALHTGARRIIGVRRVGDGAGPGPGAARSAWRGAGPRGVGAG